MASRAKPHDFPSLLGFQDKGPVPVRRRRALPEGVEARGIKIEYVIQAKAIIRFAASNNRLSSAIEVALAIARKHLADNLIHPLKAVTARNVLATENRVNGFRFGFSFHSNKI